MPPRAQYTKAEIAAAAYALIRRDGADALTARGLAERLHTSVSPIFRVFSGMDEVKLAARELALAEFMERISDYRSYTPAFKYVGMRFVTFAIEEPELFKLVFMLQHSDPIGFRSSLQELGDMPDICTQLICQDYGLTQDEAELLFEQCWILAFGLGTLCANRVCSLSEEDIGQRLGMAFMAHIMLIKSGRMRDVHPDVQPSGSGLYHGHRLDSAVTSERAAEHTTPQIGRE